MNLKEKPLPGYTGFIPEKIKEEIDFDENIENHIPGYSGFVKGIKGENLFGTTYGKLTKISKLENYSKGIDIPKQQKYLSIIKENFINHNDEIRKIIFERAGKKQNINENLDHNYNLDIDYEQILNNY